MKELSIEEKAKAYDEALERAKEMIKAMTNIGGVAKVDDIQYIFQLNESEDEKIKKCISDVIKEYNREHNWSHIFGVTKDDCLAWLKKQGETFSKKDVDDAYLKGICDAKHELEKQGEKGTNGNEREIPNSEQKPAEWSEEDENIRQWIISDIDKLLALKKKSFIIADKEINWLKSIKDRVQPKQEWSEQNERIYKSIAYSFAHNYPLTVLQQEFVKSLRHQNHWKPSDEQMKQLDWIAKQNKDNMIGKELMSLYQDLKKLKS